MEFEKTKADSKKVNKINQNLDSLNERVKYLAVI